jgi:hypothetical protein
MGQVIRKKNQNDWLGISLIAISSVLLAIWAVKHTIALRNILLVLGAVLSLFYFVQLWRTTDLKKYLVGSHGLPLLLIFCSLLWVLVHYWLFSLFPKEQFDEIDSVWLRAFLALLLGLGTGLALQKYPLAIISLWIGILISFAVVFFQYIPKAIARDSLFAPDVFGYIFHVKINTVLIGSLCMAGLGGIFLDYFLYQRSKLLHTVPSTWLKGCDISLVAMILLGMLLLLYSYVFIFDTKNGLIASVFLLSGWTLISLINLYLIQKKKNISVGHLLRSLILIICAVLTVSFFIRQHVQVNLGWQNLIADIKVATQIDAYPHWKNVKEMGYPNNALNQPVAANTYERVAWARAGVREILANPLGAGVLAGPYAALTNPGGYLAIKTDYSGVISTHSAWVEFGLAYGWPYLGFIFTNMAILLIFSIRARVFRYTSLSLVCVIALIYLIGEVSSQHGVEILYYFLALIAALVIPTRV